MFVEWDSVAKTLQVQGVVPRKGFAVLRLTSTRLSKTRMLCQSFKVSHLLESLEEISRVSLRFTFFRKAPS